MTLQEAAVIVAKAQIHVDGPFPTLGDSQKRYKVELTEPEINAIHGAFGFMRGACQWVGFKRFWEHYGPTLQALSDRLGEFDD